MENNKNKLNKNNSYLKPVLIFYAKTTSWIIFPLLLAVLIGNHFNKLPQGQTLFLVCIMAGFGISCSGIYQQIKQYKKDLDKEKKDGK